MDRWEIPSCSICYERLLSKLSLLPNCGHIYHDKCLNSWIQKIKPTKLSCPLCRTDVNYTKIISLNYTITKIEDLNINGIKDVDSSYNDDLKSDVINFGQIKLFKSEIDDLKSRLSKSSDDHIDDLHKIYTLENRNKELQSKLKNELNLKELIIKENRNLKLSHEKDKATNSALISRLESLKNDLDKYKHISRYLEEPNIAEIQDIANFLENMTSDDKINFLSNRIVDLQGIINELKDVNESVTLERDRIDKLYRNLMIAFKEEFAQKNQPQIHEKPQLPGIENEDFMDVNHEKRKLMDKLLSRPKDELPQITSTPNRTKTSMLKGSLSTPDRSTSFNLNTVSDMMNTNIDSKNLALQNIIKKMKTMQNGGTPPPRYNGPTSVNSNKSPERPVIVKSIRNGSPPDKVTVNTDNSFTSPFRTSKNKTVRKVKHNAEPAKNDKTFTIQAFFKQKKDNVL